MEEDQEENQQKTQAIYCTGLESNVDHIGRRALTTAPSLLPNEKLSKTFYYLIFFAGSHSFYRINKYNCLTEYRVVSKKTSYLSNYESNSFELETKEEIKFWISHTGSILL